MVEINAYSKAKDGGKKLSANFTVKEFACKDGSDAVLTAPRLVMVLQSIRSHFAAPGAAEKDSVGPHNPNAGPTPPKQAKTPVKASSILTPIQHSARVENTVKNINK